MITRVEGLYPCAGGRRATGTGYFALRRPRHCAWNSFVLVQILHTAPAVRSPWWDDLVPKPQGVNGLVPGEARSWEYVWAEEAASLLSGRLRGPGGQMRGSMLRGEQFFLLAEATGPQAAGRPPALHGAVGGSPGAGDHFGWHSGRDGVHMLQLSIII